MPADDPGPYPTAPTRGDGGESPPGDNGGRGGPSAQSSGRFGFSGQDSGTSEEASDRFGFSEADFEVSGEASAQLGGAGRRSGRSGASRRRSGRSRGAGQGFDGPVPGSVAASGPEADPAAVARAICLRLLTLAPRTRAELARALRKRDVPEDVAEAVLDRYTEVGLIDDEAYAEAWVDSRHAGRGLARRALASELRTRGVAEDTVRDAVDRLDPEQEVETARRLVARRLPATEGLEPAARVRRLAGMLARKGYSGGIAYRVVREALESEGQPTEDELFDGLD
ncbi:recombination regulator RecX [Sphaerisporangium sp. B11E5]|uniref:recombination regulator RecX n=1 Tax=Sphaerisporangium sp. B11E5 TaxID=3153563 RepID=UPI00325D3346